MPDSDPVEHDETSEVSAGWLERLRARDYTQGSLYKSLFVLSIPLVATSLFGGVIFQMGDLK